MKKVIIINDYENNSIDFLNYDKIEILFNNQKEEENKSDFIEDYLISKNIWISGVNYIIVKVEDIFIKNSIFLNDNDKKELLNNIN